MVLFFSFSISIFCFTQDKPIDPHHLRAILLRIQDHLSDDDRKCLHFFLGSDVPRRIRDDPSLSGTLNLMESLFDQDKINERDFTFLINAFDEIRCVDAVKILRGSFFPKTFCSYFYFDRAYETNASKWTA